ncbi:MAG TPA: T9SS type A sorting domain-containing protein, partial [candidate division WOR-3 bacterium]|nr:T9SS type A sorting domain-containing protein [candidate division WOR-3 bacterium]
EIYKGRRIDLFVYDVMGRMVKKSSIRVNNGKILLNLRGLRSGVYFVEVKDRNNIYKGKFVKFGR